MLLPIRHLPPLYFPLCFFSRPPGRDPERGEPVAPALPDGAGRPPAHLPQARVQVCDGAGPAAAPRTARRPRGDRAAAGLQDHQEGEGHPLHEGREGGGGGYIFGTSTIKAGHSRRQVQKVTRSRNEFLSSQVRRTGKFIQILVSFC